MRIDALPFETLYADNTQDNANHAQKKEIIAVQISDAHFSKKKALFDNTIDAICAINPDIIFFTGDQAVSKESVAVMEHYLSMLTKRTNAPVLIINGNWDYIPKVPRDEYKQALLRANCILLENSSFTHTIDGKTLYIYGVDDLLFGTPSFDEFFPVKNSANIVLGHCPPLFDQMPTTNEDVLFLSGHTHGGQFLIFGRAVYFPVGTGKYYKGFYTRKNHTLFVSTGLGNSSADIRNVPPVIERIKLTFDDDGNFEKFDIQSLTISTKHK